MTLKIRSRLVALERAMEEALAPGRRVSYNASFDFVRDLEQVEQRIQPLILTDAADAITLYETFLAGCYEKAEDAYLALTEEAKRTPQDCHALAAMLVARRKPQEALAWAERGIELDGKVPHGSGARLDLVDLSRDLLVKLGRGNEALAAAWAEYREHPSTYSYDDLMRYVPQAERAAWHEKAIKSAKGKDLGSLIELLLETKELARLADLVGRSKDLALEGVSHYATQPAAKKLEESHPGPAARLWRAQGVRIVKAGKSKYYDIALENLECARRCYEKAGLAGEWRKLVQTIRSEHRRKTGFMAGFEELVAGSGPGEKPSFLERAKARWSAREVAR